MILTLSSIIPVGIGSEADDAGGVSGMAGK
jgi:hypothetical protein